MDLSPYIAALRDDLTTTASAGDDTTRRAAAVLAAAIEPAARLAIMNALADLAAEVTAALPDHVVEARLDGRDIRVVVTGTGSRGAGAETPPAAEDPPRERAEEPRSGTGDRGSRGWDFRQEFAQDFKGGDMSRMTLRLFEELKAKAEQAASTQGVSLNTFVQQALQGALSGNRRHGSHSSSHSTSQSSGSTGSSDSTGSGGSTDSGSRSTDGSRVRGWYEG